MAVPPTIKPVPNLPKYRWNAPANRYISPQGRFVSTKNIRDALDGFIKATTEEMGAISTQLVSGELTLAEWQAQMMVMSKDVNLAGAALNEGGWYNMSQADFGKAGNKIRGEYGYLNNFANEIADGTQKLDGTLANRAKLYGEQGRVSYYDFAEKSAREDGYEEERSVLSPSESCDVCVSEDSLGWRPLGQVIPIGDRTCLSRCNCFMQYRAVGKLTRTA